MDAVEEEEQLERRILATTIAMASSQSAARGVTAVVERCEIAKETGFLDLSNCSLLYVADAIYLVLKEYQSSINRCSFAHNQLSKFPKKLVQRFTRMTAADFACNKIVEIPDDIQQWADLKELSLAGNKISTLPDVRQTFPSLTTLDLSDNVIQEITTPLNWPSLRRLILRGNPLSEDSKRRLRENEETGLDITF